MGLLVAQATRLFRPATRRTEPERQSEPMGAAFSQRCSPQFRSAGRPRHPFSKHGLRFFSPRVYLLMTADAMPTLRCRRTADFPLHVAGPPPKRMRQIERPYDLNAGIVLPIIGSPQKPRLLC